MSRSRFFSTGTAPKFNDRFLTATLGIVPP
jgi:hypothetical protein